MNVSVQRSVQRSLQPLRIRYAAPVLAAAAVDPSLRRR